MKHNFRNLYFGMASAEAEASSDPARFMRTYYDRWDIRAALKTGSYFLFVGPKGVGKSAVHEFAKLHLADKYGNHAVFARSLNLDEISPGVSPLSAITQKLASDESAGITDSAWRLFLAVRLLELLEQDQSCRYPQYDRVEKLIADLRRTGLAASDFPTVLRRVRENKGSFSIKGLLGYDATRKDTEDVSVSNLGRALLEVILQACSENHFLLAIDGLDRIISDNPAYWRTLAALIRVGDDLHLRLRESKTDIRLLVMCRSDVFRSIHFSDADKIAGDSVLFMDWGAHQTTPRDSHLWDYLAAKAEISPDELFKLLPNEVTVGERGNRPRKIEIAEYLIQFTRSTPRELSLLMKQVQEAIPPGGYVSSERVREAADNFASRNLLTIVNAEATGTIAQELRGQLNEIISNIPTATNVTLDDLAAALEASGASTSLAQELAEFLFLAGLLGNYDSRTGYVQFYHRRDTYKFKRKGPWTLQLGLMYAFNIPYAKPK